MKRRPPRSTLFPSHTLFRSIGGEGVAQAERPADAQHSAARVVHIEGVLQGERGRGTAKAEIGDAGEEGKIGGVDEDLRKPGIAAGGTRAERIVRRKAILAGAAESGLGAIPAGGPTGTSQDQQKTTQLQ